MGATAAPSIGAIIGIGASCFVSAYHGQTVLKGYEIWVDGKRRSYKFHTCEEAVCWEEYVYKHLGSHPRILACYGLVEVRPGAHSLRLELAPLGNVREYTETHGEPPGLRVRLQMARDVAAGLSHVHSRGVQHGDLSCRNLFLFHDFRVKIGDFGASLVGGRGCAEQTVCEEMRYELPCRGRAFDDRPVAERELFALGSAIYEIVAWARPFPDLDEEEVEARYAREEFPPLEDLPVGLTIMNCWKEVCETADEVVASLDKSLAACYPSAVQTSDG